MSIKIINRSEWKEVVEYLKNDKIVAYPTDTVYGLAAKYDSEVALLNLVKAKNRPKEKNFPIMVSDIEMLKDICYLTDRDIKIINKFMPGPLTVVLNSKKNTTLAIRFAHEEELYKIIKDLSSPIYLTSANKSDFPVCKTVDEIIENKLCDLIVDGKPLGSIASTIVDLTNGDIKILREGLIKIDDILKVI